MKYMKRVELEPLTGCFVYALTNKYLQERDMINKYQFLRAATLAALVLSAPALAENITTQAVTNKTSVVNPDGSVSYQSHTVVKKTSDPLATPVMTFYYYEPTVKRIVSSSDLSPPVLKLWDANNNNVIDNHEFYNNALIMYEPVEYSKRTYQDIDGDGLAELTQQEYTLRLQKLPLYTSLNTDNKEGLTLREFTGVGFQDADIDNDNQVTFDEFKQAFYHEKGLAPKPEKINN
jgi:hypothetical protein